MSRFDSDRLRVALGCAGAVAVIAVVAVLLARWFGWWATFQGGAVLLALGSMLFRKWADASLWIGVSAALLGVERLLHPMPETATWTAWVLVVVGGLGVLYGVSQALAPTRSPYAGPSA